MTELLHVFLSFLAVFVGIPVVLCLILAVVFASAIIIKAIFDL